MNASIAFRQSAYFRQSGTVEQDARITSQQQQLTP